MNIHSIRFKLIAWSVGIFLILCLGFGVYTYCALQHYLTAALQENLARRANQIGTRLIANIGTLGEDVVIDEIRSLYAPELNDRFIRITKPDGSILYTSGKPADKSFDPSYIPQSTGFAEGVFTISNAHILIVSRKFLIQKQPYLVEVGASTLESEKVRREFARTLAIALPVFLILSVGGGLILIKQALVPVERVTNAAQEITFHKLSKRLPVVSSGDEIEHLTVALNQMIERLDAAFQLASRFTSDASHELRTPLTIMRGELEEAVQDLSLGKTTREKIGSVLEETERLVKIVEGLLAISRLESGEALLERTRFDLSNLVVTTTEQMSLLAEEKGIAIQCDAARRVEVEGDKARLKQVVVNLLDNAIKYTPKGGRIVLETKNVDGRATFIVTDSGAGIPKAALSRIFDRFYRADDERTREVGGAGLGLSIVRSICQAHGGSISASNVENGGCRVMAQFPLAIEPERNSLGHLSLL